MATTSNPCGTSGNNGDGDTIVVVACCGIPEPVAGWSGNHVNLVLSSPDLSAGGELTIYAQGVNAAALLPPSASQRFYIFSYQVVVGAAGIFELFENVTGDSAPPGEWATIARGSLAKHGGLLHRVPNRMTRLGNTLHAKHSVAGQVDVIVHGRYVTEV